MDKYINHRVSPKPHDYVGFDDVTLIIFQETGTVTPQFSRSPSSPSYGLLILERNTRGVVDYRFLPPETLGGAHGKSTPFRDYQGRAT